MHFDFSPWAGLVSAAWLVFYIFGRRQFSRVRQGTTELVLEQGRLAGQARPRPTVEGFFAQIQPAWRAMLRQRAWFIPHRTELFPVPAQPEVVARRLNFTPGWVGAYLRLNGVDLPAGSELEAEIQRILALAGSRLRPRRP
ncbi:MAG: hypothetical protein ABSH53_22830 [Holophaga sp.]|jgi:hypothetical protein